MPGKRERLVELLDSIGAASLLLRARRRLRLPWLTALTYHRVGHPDPGVGLDDAVIDATPEAFDRQVALLTRHFTLIGIAELMDWLRGARLPPNPVLITFDDGYLDCHTHALPILRRHGARAVFFVPTWYISERRVFWWDRINYLVKRSRRERIELAYPERRVFDLAAGRRPVTRALLDVIKRRHGLDLERFLGELGAACGVDWDAGLERSVADRTLMTWDHLRELRQAGMDVQSHTRTHRVLQTLGPAELREELFGSRAELEHALAERVETIAYPVGYRVNAFPDIRGVLEAAGYQLGFTSGSGVTHTVGRPDRFDIRRIAVDADFSESFFRGIMALPQLARRPLAS